MAQQAALKMEKEAMADGSVHPKIARVTGWLVLKLDIFVLSSVCLFVLFVWDFSSHNFSLIWRRHHYRRRAANSDLCSALMAIEQ